MEPLARILILFFPPLLLIAYFFHPAPISLTISPSQNVTAIDGLIKVSSSMGFNNDSFPFNLNTQFIKYEAKLKSELAVRDNQNETIIHGSLIYADASGNTHKLPDGDVVSIGSNLSRTKAEDTLKQFGEKVEYEVPVGERTIPPHSTITFDVGGHIIFIPDLTLKSYAYLYLLLFTAWVGFLRVVVKESILFLREGSLYFKR